MVKIKTVSVYDTTIIPKSHMYKDLVAAKKLIERYRTLFFTRNKGNFIGYYLASNGSFESTLFLDFNTRIIIS